MAERRIFNVSPDSWEELQDFVGQLFDEAGYQVEVAKTVDLVRGHKEVDVFVNDTNSPNQPTYLFECKYWKAAVHQEVVHAFQTVMEAFGANFGFIVAKNGFQAGAYEAAEHTNIRLVSLQDLEEEFYDEWQHGMVAHYLPLSNELFPYWDPSGGKMPADGKPISWDAVQLVSEAYRPVTQLGEWHLHGKLNVKYPMIVPLLNDALQTVGQLHLHNDRDLFNFIKENQEKARQHFKQVYRE